MADLFYIPLAHRSLFSLAGEDRRTFLQGLVSNDVAKAAPDRTLYGAFLTPQGKFLHEFFLGEKDDAFWLETETGGRDDFVRRLSIYKLRSKVGMATTDGVRVFALLGRDPAAAIGLPGEAGAAGPFGGGVVFVDPRLPAAGLRGWLPEGAEAALAAPDSSGPNHHTGMRIVSASAFPMAAAIWFRKRPSCWKTGSTSCMGWIGRRGVTSGRN